MENRLHPCTCGLLKGNPGYEGHCTCPPGGADYEHRRPNLAQEPVDGVEHLQELARIWFYSALDAALMVGAMVLCWLALTAWFGGR